jgi:hypothetical protein
MSNGLVNRSTQAISAAAVIGVAQRPDGRLTSRLNGPTVPKRAPPEISRGNLMASIKAERSPIAKCADNAQRRPVVSPAGFDRIHAAAAVRAAPARTARIDPWAYENKARDAGHLTIAGIDEAGRGPLAGPVVAAAVILPDEFPPAEVTDSKQLAPLQRDRLYQLIYARAVAVGIGIVDAVEIDRINILRAALLAMAMAARQPRTGAGLSAGGRQLPGAAAPGPANDYQG